MTPGINRIKTWILIAALGGLFVLIGSWLGGTRGAFIALVIALVVIFVVPNAIYRLGEVSSLAFGG